MKIESYLRPAFILISLLPINPNFAQTMISLPDCASADSDADGDGFGWENSQSCLVVGGQAEQAQTGQCIDTDGDGFGWNGVVTCDPTDNATQTTVTLPNCASVDSDSDGDGFGFENNQSCLVGSGDSVSTQEEGIESLIIGEWICRDMHLQTDRDPATWITFMLPLQSAAMNNNDLSCPTVSGSQSGDVSQYIFGPSQEVLISRGYRSFAACGSSPEFSEYGISSVVTENWTVDGFSLTIGETNYPQVGFESSAPAGVEINQIHFYTNSTNRLTCLAPSEVENPFFLPLNFTF